MKGLTSLFLGIFGTFAFSWVGLTVIPNWQIGHLNPQSDEEGTDIYPQPQSGMVERGSRVYAANGCIYCHSQQVRADYAANDIERKWGDRRSAPRDYIFERPVFLGKMRMGQDIANIGARAPKEQESPAQGGAAPAGSASGGTSPAAAPASATSPAAPSSAASPAAKQISSPSPSTQAGSPAPAGSPSANSPAPNGAAVSSPLPATSSNPSAAPWPVQTAGFPPMYSAAWQHVHLYSPRSINDDSNMPSYRFLYEKRRIGDARSADALQLTGSDAPPEGWEIVPSFDAKCLVAYLMALNQSHPLKEVRSVGGAPAAPAPAAVSPAPPPAAAKK
jgi:cbb3-type cytochrome oxidase cytochrome c subunit